MTCRTALALVLGMGLAAPAMAEGAKIGVAMTSFDNPFLTILLNGIKAEAQKDGAELLLEDAQLDVARQQNQVQNFIANGVDAIIVNAVDGAATPAMTQMAEAAGVPLVYVNHPPINFENLPAGTSFVGSNETEGGTMEAAAVCKQLGGKGDVMVLMGPLENEASGLRTKAIESVIATPDCQGMTIVDRQVGNWNRTQGQDITANWLTAGTPFDAIISNNDEMAIGAIQALNAAGVDKEKVVVAGIDATPDGLAAMQAGDLDVTVFQNATRQGEVAVQAALAMARGEATDRNIWVPFEAVTPENLADYR
ncbi:sugar ABC transporter substrate-binding protein [Paracoccus aminovorans]|uniref:sugar ABC transporter substrate-binding protein n=1 Tax=Paracoccus aminovorans TaxID=34004 RepID=UPI0007817C9D|nr:sugar ABC transporter substrate-binding protein [Paracoccus aminovorans]MDQ7777955.1 sugar ABC transporter substrate-binding protein [Paracoccus aminovorans]